ncbi:iron-containing alcohol dehydrogenase [Rhodobacteraceae bacterium XHP0102]|nr:iron-containing alcohol dehydrogenase [Rhodobacteraceae bacterium XHP0102]
MTHSLGFQFMSAAQIRFGRGIVDEDLASSIVGFGTKVLLVTGRSGVRHAGAQAMVTRLAPIETVTIASEPDLKTIEAAVMQARGLGVDIVLSIGGGAVIDAGKAIAALIPAPHPALRYLEVVGEGRALDYAPVPFVAIPTTAGTGAEVTKNAVIFVPEHNRKVSLRDDRMLPVLAVIDPCLCDGMGRAQTMMSGLDALTQVVEPYLCTRANPFTDALCRDAIPRAVSGLRRLSDAFDRDGDDPLARDDVALASVIGGLALANAGLGAVHGLAGPAGGYLAQHGLICARLLVPVLLANEARAESPALRGRFADLRAWMGDAFGVSPEMAFEALARFIEGQNLPRLGQAGLPADKIAQIAQAAASSSSMKANPVDLTASDLTEILREAL